MHIWAALSQQREKVCVCVFDTNLVLAFLVVEAEEPAESSDTERWKSRDRCLSSLGLRSSGSGKSSSVSGSTTSMNSNKTFTNVNIIYTRGVQYKIDIRLDCEWLQCP